MEPTQFLWNEPIKSIFKKILMLWHCAVITSSPPHWHNLVIFDHRVNGSNKHSSKDGFWNKIECRHKESKCQKNHATCKIDGLLYWCQCESWLWKHTIEQTSQLSLSTAGGQDGTPRERRGQRNTAEERTKYRTRSDSNHFLSWIRFASVSWECATLLDSLFNSSAWLGSSIN